jgi:hypothetical protein
VTGVQTCALPIYQSESVRKFQGHHSTDKNVPRLVERHFPERIPPTEKKARHYLLNIKAKV